MKKIDISFSCASSELSTRYRQEVANKLIENVEGLSLVEDSTASNTTFLKYDGIENVYLGVYYYSSYKCIQLGIATDLTSDLSTSSNSANNCMPNGATVFIGYGGTSSYSYSTNVSTTMNLCLLKSGFLIYDLNYLKDTYPSIGVTKSSADNWYFFGLDNDFVDPIRMYLYGSNMTNTTKYLGGIIVPLIYFPNSSSGYSPSALNVAFKDSSNLFLMNPYVLATYDGSSDNNTILNEYLSDIYCTCTKQIKRGIIYKIGGEEYIAVATDILVKNN